MSLYSRQGTQQDHQKKDIISYGFASHATDLVGVPLSGEALRRHVVERAHHLRVAGGRRGRGGLLVVRAGGSEVREFNASSGVHQDVPRLVIAQ
jgi:hypothetical protein